MCLHIPFWPIFEHYSSSKHRAWDLNPDLNILVKLQETRRLAVVDLDWSIVTAIDILAVMRSFVMAGGGLGAGVTRVTVYPSDYGLEKMAEEALAGPQVGSGV